jgi:hypothetical protein
LPGPPGFLLDRPSFFPGPRSYLLGRPSFFLHRPSYLLGLPSFLLGAPSTRTRHAELFAQPAELFARPLELFSRPAEKSSRPMQLVSSTVERPTRPSEIFSRPPELRARRAPSNWNVRIPEHLRGERGRAAACGFPDLPDLALASVTGHLIHAQREEKAMDLSILSSHGGDQRHFAMNIDHRRIRGLRVLRGLSLLLGLLVLGGCEASQKSAPGLFAVAAADAGAASVEPEKSRMLMIVGERRFAITLTDNASARAFATQLPLTLDMSELNGNEKHADLPESLPANASRPGTIRNGDLMLYGTNTLVVFYLTFSSSYSYTRIGRVDDSAGLAQALGRHGVRVTFSKD